MTPDDMIGQYIKLRDHVTERKKVHTAELKPYDEALTIIENALAVELNRQGLQSFKGEHGTAFKKRSMSVRTVDREALFSYVQETGNYSYLTSAVSKDAVKEHLEKYDDVPPPGVDVTFFVEVQVRKPT